MEIRRATIHETRYIVDQSLEVLKEATMGHVTPTPEKSLQMMSLFLSNEGYYLVAVENDVVAGWVGIGSTIDYLTNELIGVIPEIYVLPKYRKYGIAERLCEDAFRQLKEGRHDKVQLHVFAGNHAKQLYQKLGFQEVSTLMEKKLDG